MNRSGVSCDCDSPLRRHVRRGSLILVALLMGAGPAAFAQSEPVSPAQILQQLEEFNQLGSVLYVAAHPDDENTQLITWLARGRHVRTAYLSITRGDGGQNLLGPEFGELLGVARTQELLAARRLDGGRQYFTRAIDFGFSKDFRETLEIWNRHEVLGDVVRVIRTFRPDVIVTRFSPVPGGTHGHHTASAVLAREAFRLAADPGAYPEQLKELKPWQVKRVLQNGAGGRRGQPPPAGGGVLRIEMEGTDPVTGASFWDIAARSRGMHKTQFENVFGGGRGARTETFQLLEGDSAEQDLFDGVDTTWGRVRGGAEIGRLATAAIAKFDTNKPAASIPALIEIRKQLAKVPADRLVSEKRQLLDDVLRACAGLTVETIVPDAEVVAGETLALRHRVELRVDAPVRWLGVRYPGVKREIMNPVALKRGELAERESSQVIPRDTPLSQPYWLREDGTPGLYRVENPSLIGTPENPPVFPVEHVFEIAGETVIVPDEPIHIVANASADARRRKLEIISPVVLEFPSEVRLFSPGATRQVEVVLRAMRPGLSGSLTLKSAEGWKVDPAMREFRIARPGETQKIVFNVTAPEKPSSGLIQAVAKVGDAEFGVGRVEIRYDHIPLQVLQPAARARLVCLDMNVAAKRVGYVPGAGDSVAAALQEMGCNVETLAVDELQPDRLRNFDSVVLGIRALNVRDDLAARMPALMEFVSGGGTLVVQYTQPEGRAGQFGPLSIQLSRQRVTNEEAPMEFLVADHPALNRPNRIVPEDFAGWVQERGLYFASQWDEAFTPVLASADQGEDPLKGGLLVARHGQGHVVYTGLAFFRQLPAGVPGAYRLFANLVSLGK